MVEKRRKDPKAKSGWSPYTAGNYFRSVRMFVRRLWMKEAIPAPPKNLDDRPHTFGRPPMEPPTFTVDEVRVLLGAARGVHKLIVLLMLNTGATQKDVSDLRPGEIDLVAGRITRFRSEMARKKSARLASHKVWPSTVELLREYADLDPAAPRALLTRTGRPRVRREIGPDLPARKSDGVRSVFDDIRQPAGITGMNKSVKVFGKTSASLINDGRGHRDLRHWLPGHSEKTVADRHYSDVV